MADTAGHRSVNPALEARDREMVRLRNERFSLEEIGKAFPRNGRPMTKEGVRVALQRAAERGLKVSQERGHSKDHVNKHTERATARRDEARSLFLAGTDEDTIATKMGICDKTLRGYLDDLPEYAVARKEARRQPTKSALTYEQMKGMRESGSKIREISAAAGVTPSRVSQVLQRKGLYEPTPETAERIEAVMGLLADNVSVRSVAAQIGRSPSQVYAYRSLAESLGSAGTKEPGKPRR